MGEAISDVQYVRDCNGLANVCAACGQDCDYEMRPLTVVDGMRIHVEHLHDPGSGYYEEES